MAFEYLRYLHHSFRYPQLRRLGFPRLGLGVEQRRKKLALYWDPHLQKSLSKQAEWATKMAEQLNRGEHHALLVLGAGRLYDFNSEALANLFSKITLLDADPLCIPFWKNLQKKLSRVCHVEFRLMEITGRLGHWRDSLNESLCMLYNKGGTSKIALRWKEALQLLQNLPHAAPLERNHGSDLKELFSPADRPFAVLSLNMLSQIPVTWQDIVERLLIRYFTKHWVAEHKDEWLASLYPNAQLLVKQHFQDLQQLSPQNLLLLSDLEYVHYRGTQNYSSRHYQDPPLVWTSTADKGDRGANQLEGEWSPNSLEKTKNSRQQNKEESTTCEIFGALYDIDLENSTVRSQFLSDYHLVEKDSWVWHIAPQGTDDRDKGIVHRVGAFSFIHL